MTIARRNPLADARSLYPTWSHPDVLRNANTWRMLRDCMDGEEAIKERGEEYPVKVDGDYGPATRRAVTAFQLDHGLTVDGVAGPQTIEAIEKATPVAAGAREYATTRDLREEESQIVRNSDNASKAVVGLAGSGGLIAAAPELIEQGQKIAEGGDVARSVVDSLGELVTTLMAHPSIILIALAVLAVIYFTNKAKSARVEDRIEGRTV